MFNINRTESFVIVYWTGTGWSPNQNEAKIFTSREDAQTEKEEWGIRYTTRISAHQEKAR